MTAQDRRGQSGFTLIELMIVVAIIGILASIAIPAFLQQQNISKRAEAFSNLSSLAKVQKARFAEFGDFIDEDPQPSSTSAVSPSTTKRSWPAGTRFELVGWSPEGQVYFDYDTNTPFGPAGGLCACVDACFTAAAYGDLDGKNGQSVILYTHPGPDPTEFCGSAVHNKSPPVNADGDIRINETVRVFSSDAF